MVFEITANPLEKVSCGAVVVFVFKQKDEVNKTESFLSIDKVLNGLLSDALKLEKFKGKAGETLAFHTNHKILAPKVLVLGLGEKEEFDKNEFRKAFSLLSKSVKKSIESLAFLLPKEVKLDLQEQAKIAAEGLLLGSYTFNKYRTSKEESKELQNIIISEGNKNSELKIKEGIKEGQIYSDATKVARDLVNEPSSIVNPTFLANLAQSIAKGNPEIKCTVFDKYELEKMGMNAFLGVAAASDTPPKFIVLEYTGKISSKKKLAIVGKGITFDTGGISLKPESAMLTMKCDMSGAAAVLGLFSVISKVKPDFNIMGIIAATPNMVSGKSLVPGDVLKAYNGKTIEILNTDAEGRVTLADALSYAVKKGATEIIDLATLTGACEVALGTEIAGLFSNNDKIKEEVEKAAKEAGEKVWELPLVKEYKELNKSDVADISNISVGRWGGAITAALFLEEFVDRRPWVHLDIAGPAFSTKGNDLGPKGGTGFGVRTLLNLLKG